jgi:uroporphyrinogen-III synthase
VTNTATLRPFTVLITRPDADAGPLTAALAAHGIAARREPLLLIDFLPGPALDLAGVQAILATSANGVRALSLRTDCRTLPLLAVGDATAREARALGFAAVESASGDVQALAALAKRRLDPAHGALLHGAGTALAGDLAASLTAAGFACRREVLYRARTAETVSEETAAALRNGALDGVLLYSPRTAATFARLVSAAGLAASCARLRAFCLSAAVAAAVPDIAWRAIVVAAVPTEEALVAAVACVAAEAASHGPMMPS